MRMFKFTPTVNDAIIHGYLYWCEDIEDRSQDMLEASFPNGALLCAGWEPEDDPEGKYQITISRGLEMLYMTEELIFEKACACVQKLINESPFVK